jgi:hypothetical protein
LTKLLSTCIVERAAFSINGDGKLDIHVEDSENISHQYKNIAQNHIKNLNVRPDTTRK